MLTGLSILLLVVVALLAIPVELEFTVEWPDGIENELVVVWALGLVRARIPVGERDDEALTGEIPSGRKRRRKKPDRRQSRNMLAAVRQRPFRRRLYRFVGDLWRSIIKENLRFRARVGLGDPADTGRLWAVMGPVSGLLSGLKDASVVIEPDFAELRFECEGSGRFQFVPLHILTISLGLLASPVIWRGLRSVRS